MRLALSARSSLVVAIFLGTACRTPGDVNTDVKANETESAGLPPDNQGIAQAVAPAVTPIPIPTLSVPTLDSEGQFAGGSVPANGLIRAGRAMKFFIDNRVPASPKLFFINANFAVNGTVPEYAKFHYYFAQKQLSVPEDGFTFNNVTYFTENKRYMAGTVQTYMVGDQQVYGIQFYPQDIINGAKAVAAVKLVAAKIKIPGAKFAFVEQGSQQSVAAQESDLTAAGFKRLTIEGILGSINYIPMHEGTAYGYLRVFPATQDNLTAADIVVFNDLPLDLTVVAGVITRAYQDTNSHINLKSKERNTPNAVLRDAGPNNQALAQWEGKPVKLTIKSDTYTIESSTDEVIAQKLKEKFNKPWLPIAWKKATTLRSYDTMCGGSAPADCLKQGEYFGSKSANLGFLANKNVLGRKAVTGTMSAKVGYDIVPFGFGIPLQFYKDLVDYPANAKLKTKITELVTKEKANQLSPAQRIALLNEVQELFFKARFPPANLAKIKQQMQASLPGIEKVKVRSSANAEDIEGFDGAGLHDSYSAKPAEVDNADESCTRVFETEEGGEPEPKMSPRTLQCGIKGVYASLWNKRAIEERSFARIDHATVSMGISVLPAYDYQSKIAGNAVAVTRVINSPDVFGYTLSIQKKNNLVTNPDPGTFSEVQIAALGVTGEPTTFTVTRFAKPKADKPQLTTTVLTKEQVMQMVDIARKVEVAYCKSKPGFYAGNCNFVPVDAEKPKALDFEFKFLESNQWVCKQAREFAGK